MSRNAFNELERERIRDDDLREIHAAEREAAKVPDIQPCPFCGDGDPAIDEIELGIWAVCCNGCRTIGPHCDGEQSASVAIDRWNQRGDQQ